MLSYSFQKHGQSLFGHSKANVKPLMASASNQGKAYVFTQDDIRFSHLRKRMQDCHDRPGDLNPLNYTPTRQRRLFRTCCRGAQKYM